MTNRLYNKDFTNYRNIPELESSKIGILFNSIKDMDTNELRNITTNYQIPMGVTDERGNTLIHKVLQDLTLEKNENNRLNVIKFLVSNNVNPDSPNAENITPLHLACLYQYGSIVEYLLSLNVNPNYQDSLGNTPFHYYLNGLLREYEPTHVYDLIPYETSLDKEADEISMGNIERLIWSEIKDNDAVKAIEKTIPLAFVTNKKVVNKLQEYLKKSIPANKQDSLNVYKEFVMPLYSEVQSQLIEPWNKFKEVDNISLDNVNKSIIKGFTSVKDYCSKQINDNIDNIVKLITNIYSITSPEDIEKYCKLSNNQLIFNYPNNRIQYYILPGKQKPPSTLTHGLNDILQNNFNQITPIAGGVPNINYGTANYFNEIAYPSQNAFHFINQFLTDTHKNKQCIDAADNYIELNSKSFIGGARNINLSFDVYNNLQKVAGSFANGNELKTFAYSCINKTINTIPDIGYSNFNAPGEYPQRNSFSKLLYTELNTFNQTTNADLNNLQPYDKELFKKNSEYIKENNLTPIHAIYNLIQNAEANNEIQIDRLNLNLPIEALYYIAGAINYQTDRSLSLTQAMKTILLKLLYEKTNPAPALDPITNYARLSYWIYLLLSNQKFDVLYNFVDGINNVNVENNIDAIANGTTNTDLAIIAKFCYRIFLNKNDNTLDEDMKRITGVEYTNKKEWLVYAITKYYSRMSQKPIELHLIDTIFIIRKTQDFKSGTREEYSIIDIYLKNLDLNNQFNNNNRLDKDQFDYRILINNYIPNDYRLIFGDKFKNVYYLANNLLPSRRLIYMQCERLQNDSDKEYLLKKFNESYLLGLNFISCFPLVEDDNLKLSYDVSECPHPYNRIYDLNNINSIYQDPAGNPTNLCDGVGGVGVGGVDNPRYALPYLGFIGQRNGSPNNNDVLSLNRRNFINYFNIKRGITDSQYRPSSKSGFCQVVINLERMIHNYLNVLVGNTRNNKVNLAKVFESYKTKVESNNLGRLIPIIYPIMLNINNLINKINQVSDFKIDKIEDTIEKLVNGINSINAHYFINYYLNSQTNVKIPSFFYYKLPTSNSLEKSIIFDASNQTLNLDDNYPIVGVGGNTFSIDENNTQINNYEANTIDTNDEGNISMIPSNNYIDSILAGEKYITPHTIKQYMKLSKKAALPPSLKDHYYQFYKLMVLDLISKDTHSNMEIMRQIIERNELLKMEDVDKDLLYKYQKAKIMDGLLSRYFKFLTNEKISEGIKILFKEKGITLDLQSLGLPFVSKDQDFSLSLSSKPSKYPLFSKEGSRALNNFYRINELPEEEKDLFLIYSNDYINLELSRRFRKFVLDKSIILTLLKSNAHSYLKNNENKTAIFSILRNYYYPIFSELNKRDYNISYNFINNQISQPDSNVEYPTKYIWEELKNHSNKLLNNKTKNGDILREFSFSQYNYIVRLIKSNSVYGNNILRNMELSFNVVGYMVNQYFFRRIFDTNTSFNLKEIDNILSGNNITDISTNNYPFIKDIKQINQSDYANVLEELLIDFKNERKNVNNKIRKVQRDINIIRQKYNNPGLVMTKFDEKLRILQREFSSVSKKIQEIKSALFVRSARKKLIKTNTENNTYDMIRYYNNFIANNGGNRGSYMMLWDKYLKSDDLNNDKINMLLLNITKGIYQDISNVQNPNIGHFDDIKNKSDFYHHTAETIESYFKNKMYLESNEVLEFANNLLIHLTQNAICFGFEVAIKKCLFKYLSLKHSDDNMDVLVARVDLFFNSLFRKDNKDMIEILYDDIAKRLVKNAVQINKNKQEEVTQVPESAKDILSSYIALFSLSPIKIDEDMAVYRNLTQIVNYFDSFSFRLINNWLVTIENYFRFVINQSRIIKTLQNLHGHI